MSEFGNGAPVGPRFDADTDDAPDDELDEAAGGPRDIGYGDKDAAGDKDGYHDDDEWIPDPDAPGTTKETLEAMSAELRQLTRASLVATVGCAALIFLVDLVRGSGFETTRGFLAGGLLATVNLWMLAGGYFALIERRAEVPRLLLAVGGSFITLLAVAFYVIMYRRTWTIGFGLGLAIPALGGILHGMWVTRKK
jgi:hypothetical protein